MKRTLAAILLFIFAAPLLAAESPAAARTLLFQIILLRASMNGPDELSGLPKNAHKAVADIRDFLPFKSYRILDSGLLRASESSGGSLRMEGVPPQQYDVRLTFRTSGNRLNVSNFTLDRVRKTPASTPPPLGAGVAPLPPEKPPISTSFSVDTGETIVVGSSKLGGGDALVVLFTALPNR